MAGADCILSVFRNSLEPTKKTSMFFFSVLSLVAPRAAMAAAAEDKEALVAQVQELRSQLLPQMERDRALTRAEGRPWSDAQWLSGEPSQHKYPSGPAFLPLGRTSDVTPWTGIANMNVGEWVNVALGSAALYATGFSSGAWRPAVGRGAGGAPGGGAGA